MSGINRFLSRREKHTSGSHQKQKVKSPLLPAFSPSSFEDHSSSSSVSGAKTPSSSFRYNHPSSSLSSLCLAFPDPKIGKGSPYSQATEGLVHATTADWYDDFLLQPRLISGDLQGLFTLDEKKKPEKDEEKKIKLLTQKLTRLGITDIGDPQIEIAIRGRYSNGDPEKAFDLLVLVEDSIEGIIKEYDPRVKLLGAENREGVTCYLDALLFAMFARLGSFEGIMYNSFDDEPRKKLATLLRLWVNMLRTGKLITTDITKHLQDALATCGWKDAAELCQQDASEAFTFITEKLELPLLTLKMDIYHTGKEDATDDHKFINERLLEVAIPNDPGDGAVITLEDCLEAYFNNRIEVRRHLERRDTLNARQSIVSMDSLKGQSMHIETVELDTPPPSPSASVSSPSSRSLGARFTRTPSIIQERIVLEHGEQSGLAMSPSRRSVQSRQRKGSIRKEVMMPAWQFFSLIPWYTDNAPINDAQVAAHFSSKRPVLGLCLKRYSMLPNGRAKRLNTYVDIPLEIGLPHFIQDDKMEENGPLFGNFKLSLQSVVCHRGVSTDSGHYISLVRGEAPNADMPPDTAASSDEAEDRWMRFDDLSKERISYVDIKKALKDESPYLLFYQVQPIEEPYPPSCADGEKPPSYSESDLRDPDAIGTSTTTDISRRSFDGTTGSNRNSLELASSDQPRGRTSISLEDSSGPNSLKQDQAMHAPVTAREENIGSFLEVSRRGSRVSKSETQSRSTSQTPAAEKRLSATFSRLTARMSRDKLVGAERAVDGVGDESAVVIDVEELVNNGGGDKSKLKKEKKGRNKGGQAGSHHHDHLHLLKGKRKAEAPDRECIVM
ncbi:MAG: hypothetical protein M1827_000543 [Pycnora praestabilis]|nr:MAG: hypothetical protein M1827_000543 [Pycnora praestabilis]